MSSVKCCPFRLGLNVLNGSSATQPLNKGQGRVIISHGFSHFYLHGLNLNPKWLSNYIHFKVCDEITYSFPNFKGVTVSGILPSNCDVLFMPGLKLNHVSKGSARTTRLEIYVTSFGKRSRAKHSNYFKNI